MHIYYHAGPEILFLNQLVALDDFCLQDCPYLDIHDSFKLYNIMTLDVKQLESLKVIYK